MLLLAGFHGEIDDFGLFFISNLQASAPPSLIDWALRGVSGPKTRSKNFISGHFATLRPLPQPDQDHGHPLPGLPERNLGRQVHPVRLVPGHLGAGEVPRYHCGRVGEAASPSTPAVQRARWAM